MMALRSQIGGLSRTLCHAAAVATCAAPARAFDESFANIRKAQGQRLRAILERVARTEYGRELGLRPGMSPVQMRDRAPEIRYEQIAPLVERQRAGKKGVLTEERCDRYQPTSGSSARVKWIPYTSSFLAELDAALSPFMADLYFSIPGVRRGRHYWSLSWMPTHLRAVTQRNVNDDRALLSPSKRIFSALTSPVPPWVTYADTSSESIFATLCHLAAADDLSVVSVWSPTFALNLLEEMAAHRGAIAEVLDGGRWDVAHRHFPSDPPRSLRAAQILRSWDGRLDPAFFEELWPSLALISAWDTASSARWANRLSDLLPHARFQGKGLWATEGVVTIPYGGRHPLAVRSHFYEFVDLDSERPHFPWDLERGQRVRPLLTTSAGLLRYALQDQLVVKDFIGETPCFEFLGRIDDVDMVGEKLSPEIAERALAIVARSYPCTPLSLLAFPDGIDEKKPHYVALCEGARSKSADLERTMELERYLRGSFHYDLARDVGQLAPAKVLTRPDARSVYEELGVARGMVRGNIKIEPLLLCPKSPPLGLMGEQTTGENSLSLNDRSP